MEREREKNKFGVILHNLEEKGMKVGRNKGGDEGIKEGRKHIKKERLK